MSNLSRKRFALSNSRRFLALASAPLLAFSLAQTPAYAAGPIKPQTQVEHLPNFVNLVKQVKPAVVSITSHIRADVAAREEGGMPDQGEQQGSPFPFPFPFQMMPQQQPKRTVEARGSGFIISSDGYIVTNNHVVNGATRVSVTLDDGTTLPAKVIGHDPQTDVALLKITPNSPLSFIELGDSDEVQPGEWVVAVGNPFGLGGTVTSGIVSARGRNLNSGAYDDFIQTDAPINHGNSGGPLFTQDGKVVGMNTAILSPSGGSIGIGFAIPSNTIKNVVDQLRKTGHVVRGYLGLTDQSISPTMAKALGLKSGEPGAPPMGSLVASVNPHGPADKAGVKAGDVITTLNGKPIKDGHDLAVHVVSMTPGSKATLGILRDNKPTSIDVVVGNMSKDKASGDSDDATYDSASNSSSRIGISLIPLTPDVRQQLGVDETVTGTVVNGVDSGSPAEHAGVRPGDIIQAVGTTKVTSPRAAMTAARSILKTKQPVLLRILRDGQPLFIAISSNSSQDDDGGSDDGQ